VETNNDDAGACNAWDNSDFGYIWSNQQKKSRQFLQRLLPTAT
jgi:hypothetical protein